jgi:hypothetical protein
MSVRETGRVGQYGSTSSLRRRTLSEVSLRYLSFCECGESRDTDT